MTRVNRFLSLWLAGGLLLTLLLSGCGKAPTPRTTTTATSATSTTVSPTTTTTTVTTTGTTKRRTVPGTTTTAPPAIGNLRAIPWDSIDRIEVSLLSYGPNRKVECRDKELFSRLFPLMQQVEGRFVRNSKGYYLTGLNLPTLLYSGDTYIGRLTLIRSHDNCPPLFDWCSPEEQYGNCYEIDEALQKKLFALLNEAAGVPSDVLPGDYRYPTTTRPKKG